MALVSLAFASEVLASGTCQEWRRQLWIYNKLANHGTLATLDVHANVKRKQESITELEQFHVNLIESFSLSVIFWSGFCDWTHATPYVRERTVGELGIASPAGDPIIGWFFHGLTVTVWYNLILTKKIRLFISQLLRLEPPFKQHKTSEKTRLVPSSQVTGWSGDGPNQGTMPARLSFTAWRLFAKYANKYYGINWDHSSMV